MSSTSNHSGPRRLVVVGGGISGLAAAYNAVRRAKDAELELDVLVLERDAVIGGKARSLRQDGWLLEAGPGSFLDNEEGLQKLVAESGFEDQQLIADDAAARRYYFRNDRLTEVSAHPLRFATSGLLGPLGLLRLACEPFIRSGSDAHPDESIWDFAARRLGPQAAEHLVAPMILGIYAGDARQLSLAASLPRLAQLEAEHGSLLQGMLAKRRAQPDADISAGPSGKVSAFRDGMQSLPAWLAERPGMHVRKNAAVESIHRIDGAGYELHVRGDAAPLPADAVVLAGEAWACAALLRDLSPLAAARMAEIDMPPVAVVGLGFGPEATGRVPRGFGVLVPRGGRHRTLGCLWDSYCFPGRSPEGHLLVRAMLGGTLDREIGELADVDVLKLARQEVSSMLGLEGPPVFQRLVRWSRAIPQYDLAHRERKAVVAEQLERLPGFYLAGNALAGVSFARSAATGRRIGGAAVQWLLDRS